MEHTKRNSPMKYSKEQNIMGRKITSGLFYLNRRNINRTEGLAAMYIGVKMSRPARTSLCLSQDPNPLPPVWCGTSPRSQSWCHVSCAVLPSPAQYSPVHCGPSPLFTLKAASIPALWWSCSFRFICYIWLCLASVSSSLPAHKLPEGSCALCVF